MKPILILGGAGFIGTNVAHRLLSDGLPVVVFDNLSRTGVDRNLRWLRDRHDGQMRTIIGDVRDVRAVRRAMEGVGHVFHFAAQVAVTTSLVDPELDFDVNARGTLHVLEAARAQREPPTLLFTSTNKVYGALTDIPLDQGTNRYEPRPADIRAHGINESRPLEFHSPYGCSKGTAEQYVLDYARSYDLSTLVFRMSCIYGSHQFGNEDQGWVAHFLLRALRGETITLYGNGLQVRDILHVDDLVDALLLGMTRLPNLAGRVFNIGGGPARAVSLIDVVDRIRTIQGQQPKVRFDDWRVGDQRYYVSDTRAFEAAVGWHPTIGTHEGLSLLWAWLRDAHVAHNRPAPLHLVEAST